jgi:predicted HTH transcriptional regulator
MSYFNTTNENGKQLEIFNESAKNQEEQILNLMKLYKKLSPSDVNKYFTNYPLTSVRRALTNLSNQGKLIKTDEKKIGIYRRMEYIWSAL